MQRKKSLAKFLLVVVFFASTVIGEAGIIYQTINLKDDGSGSIKLNYNAKNAELRQNNFILANFPFSEKLANSFFASPNTTVKSAKLDFSAKDSTYYMTIEVDFKNINKLNQAKGFSNVTVRWSGTDTGAVFMYTLLPGLSVPKYFDPQSYIVNFENSVKSSTGVVKDKSVTWGNRSVKNTDFSKPVALTATTTGKVPASLDVTPGTTTTAGKETSTTSKEEEKKEKSCGLFGFELPLILLAGYIFNLNSRKRKS